jgi:serine/threonine-protein kinase
VSQELALKLVPGAVVADKYRLERLLKSGGMGSVWVAHHTTLETEVAIKFMTRKVDERASLLDESDAPSDSAAMTRKRFEREAKAAAKIRSSNVVQILDHGVDRQVPYIVMELLRGEDLAVRLRRARRLHIAEVARILTPVARALARAHKEGLVHRDLKPENIFLAQENDQEVPKILDFGVAKSLELSGGGSVDGNTIEGVLVGTPQYMSPEQATGQKHVDARSDTWSLGVIVFKMLTGRAPFQPNTVLEAVVQICSAPIPAPSSIMPDLSPEVDAFFETALARDPDRRFQSPMDLATALAALVPGAPAPRVDSGSFVSTPGLDAQGAPSVTGARRPVVADVPAATPKKSPLVLVALGAGALLLGGLVLFGALRPPRPAAAVPLPAASPSAPKPAASTAAVETAAPPKDPPPPPAAESASAAPSATAASASAPAPAGSASKPQGKKRKRDVGY